MNVAPATGTSPSQTNVIIRSSTTAGKVYLNISAGRTDGSLVIQPAAYELAVLPDKATKIRLVRPQELFYINSISTIAIRLLDNYDNLAYLSTATVTIKIEGNGTFDNSGGKTYTTTVNSGLGYVAVYSTNVSADMNVIAESTELNGSLITVKPAAYSAVTLWLSCNTTFYANNIDYVPVTATLLDMFDNTVELSTGSVTFNAVFGTLNKGTASVPVTNGRAIWNYKTDTGGKIHITAIHDASGKSGEITLTGAIDFSNPGKIISDFDNGETSIELLPFAFDDNTIITIRQLPDSALTITNPEVSLITGSGRQFKGNIMPYLIEIKTLNNKATVRIPFDITALGYNASVAVGNPASSIKLYSVDDNTIIFDSGYDAGTGQIAGTVTKLGRYALVNLTPQQNMLYSNYPNPFDMSKTGYTIIRYAARATSTPQALTIKIYNVAGELITTLIDKTVTSAYGSMDETKWYGKNDNGELVASGVYMCQMKYSGYSSIIKILLIR
jgi:hypothetical protein